MMKKIIMITLLLLSPLFSYSKQLGITLCNEMQPSNTGLIYFKFISIPKPSSPLAAILPGRCRLFSNATELNIVQEEGQGISTLGWMEDYVKFPLSCLQTLSTNQKLVLTGTVLAPYNIFNADCRVEDLPPHDS